MFSLKSQNLTGHYDLNPNFPTADSTRNFQSFADLQQALSSGTVTGRVVINVAPGTYQEHFALGNITGVSQANAIIISSWGSATLTHDGTISNATVSFDGTSYVQLKDLIIRNTKDSTRANAWGIHLQNTNHISINSCSIDLPPSKTFERIGIVGSGSLTSSYISTTNNHLSIAENSISGGFSGVSLKGNTGNADLNNYIHNNLMFNMANNAIIARDQDNLIISDNVITNIYNNLGYGIYCQNIRDFEIEANNLSNCGNDGVVINGGTSSGTIRSLIANNMIHATKGKAIWMIAINTPISKVNIYHNTAVGKQAIKLLGFTYSNMNLYNNIFSARKVPFYASSLPSTVNIDYNLYHHSKGTGRNIAKVGLTRYSLAAWQTARPALNAHSVEGDPIFVDTTTLSPDLHLLGALAYGRGKGFLGIIFDIDDDIRPWTDICIGADQYPLRCPPPTGLSVVNVDTISAKVKWTPGSGYYKNVRYGLPGNELFISLSRSTSSLEMYGLNPGTNYNFYVQDSCGVGNVSAWRALTFQTLGGCPPPTGLSVVNVDTTFAKVKWTAGSGYYQNVRYGPLGNEFFISLSPGTSNLKMYGLNPGTNYNFYVQDSCGVGNVSTWSGPLTFKTLDADAISGIFTLSGSYSLDSSFPTADSTRNFQSFADLQQALSSGTVTGPVVINVAPGTYQEHFALGNITGVSQANTIIISSWLATLTHDGTISNATVSFDGTSYVQLNGLTIRNTKDSTRPTAWGIHLQNTNHISINSCSIDLPPSKAFERIGIVSSGSLTSSYISTTNNHLSIAKNSISGGYCGVSLKGNTVNADLNNYIHNNLMFNMANNAIIARDQDNLIISDNVITNIYNNLGYGIYCQNIRDFEIEANNLSNCGKDGVVIDGGTSSGTIRSLIANNMIHAKRGKAIRMRAINTPISKVNIYHNTAVGKQAIKFSGTAYSNMNLYNNIFSAREAPFHVSSSLPSTVNIDYNLYHRSKGAGRTIAKVGLTRYSLADWQAARPALNAHSVEGNPTFVSATAPVDLHIDTIKSGSQTANDIGKSGLNIDDDIDGDPRPLLPSTRVDIGADEYITPYPISPKSKMASGITQSSDTLSWTTGEPFNERSLRIYPNPSDGVFNLEFTALGEDIEVRIINMLGQVILDDELKSFEGSYRKRLDMTTHRSGIYLLQLITERTTVNRRITLE